MNAMKNEKLEWDKGEYLITGDSLILGLRERKMVRNIKGHGFSGATLWCLING